MKHMKNTIQAFLITCVSAITALAQTFTYDSSTQTVVVSGDGPNSPQVEITNPNYAGGPIPETDPVEYYGDIANVVYKDINAIETTGYTVANLENVEYRLENAKLETNAFEGGQVFCRVVIDETSTLTLWGCTTYTDEIFNSGTIIAKLNQTENYWSYDVGNYMFNNNYDEYGIGMAGVLGGTGNVIIEVDAPKLTNGIINYSGPITNLQITGVYTVDASLSHSDTFGVRNLNSTTMSITGEINIDAPNSKATGVYSNALVGTNNYSGKIVVNGTTATGVESVGVIEDLRVGTIDVHASEGDARCIVSGGDMNITAASNASISVTADNSSASAIAIQAGGNLSITTVDTLTVNGDIISGGNIEIAEGTQINFTNDVPYIKGNLTGAGANKFATNFYSIDPTGATALVGTYTPDANGKRIEGSIDNATLNSGSIKGEFVQNADNGILGWTIEKNTYLQDNIAKTAREKQIAVLLDSAVSVDNGGEQDQATAAKKIAGAANLSLLDVSGVAKLAYETTALAEAVYTDSFFRAGRILDTWVSPEDKIDAQKPRRFQKTSSDWMEVGFRTINRFGTAGAKSDTGDYDYQTYGGLANIEKKFGNVLVGGGVGGWYSKVDNGVAGKAEGDIIAVTVYTDWTFYDKFDWFAEVYYGHAMNTLKRNDINGQINTDWDGNAVGGFTAIRYTYNLLDELSIKPFVGVMATYNMQDSLNESGGAFSFNIGSKDYTNLKGVAGVEAAWQPIEDLYISARVMYAYEFVDNEYDMTLSMVGWGNANYLGYATSRSAIVAGVGVNYQLTKGWNVGVSYNAEVRSSELNNGINASVGYRW